MADVPVEHTGLGAVEGRLGVLPRNIGLIAGLIAAITCVNLASAGNMLFSTVVGLWPGVNLMGVITVGAIFAAIHAYTYSVIGTAAPHSGADYVLSSRIFGGPLGFLSSWVMLIFASLITGTFTAQLWQSLIPELLKTVALLIGSSSMMEVSTFSSVPQIVVDLGTTTLVLSFVLVILPKKWLFGVLGFGVGASVLAWWILLLQIMAPLRPFAVGWDQILGNGSFDKQISMANSLGMKISQSPNQVFQAGLVVGLWMFFGYFVLTFLAGEVKKPEETLITSSIGSLVITWLFLMAGLYMLNQLLPANWLAAESYLFQNPEYTGLSMPWIFFYGALLRPNVLMTSIAVVSWIVSLIILLQAYLLLCSRILTAWSIDGLLPKLVGYVHPSIKSPVIAVLLSALIAEVGLLISVLFQSDTGPGYFILFGVVTQIVPVLAVTLMPFLKKDWFAASKPFVRAKVGPVPLITVAGGLVLVGLGLVLAEWIVNPVLGGAREFTVITLAVIIAAGLVFYFVRRANLWQQGVVVEETFKTMPVGADEED